MTRRIGVAGFLHETNTFAPSPARMGDFIQGGGYMPFARGADVIVRSRGINLGIAGAIAYAQEQGWEVVPVLWAGAIPSAPVEAAAYEAIAGEIVAGIRDAGPLDGVFLDLHGAMVAEHEDDGEGALLSRVREAIGPRVPVAVALDLHGNITARMFEAADAMVGFRTYPHIDMADTGRRAAAVLGELMERPQPWFKAIRRLDYLIPIAWQCTSEEPAKGLYARTVAQERDGQVTSSSLFTGFPAADFPECGPVVVTYGRSETAVEAAADALHDAVLAAEPAFAGTSYEPDAGVRAAMEIARTATRPVIIADTQDNPGAGGDSDTTGMLRALVACGARAAALGCLFDPEAAKAAHAAGEGAQVTLALGGRSGVPGDAPFVGTFTVERLSDGNVVAPGPYYGGAHMRMGPSAALRIDDIRVVVVSHKAQMADRALYRMVGIEPERQAILVNKSSVHFRADFDPIAETILVCTAPGPMPLSPAVLAWKRLRPGIRLEPLGRPFSPAA
ncbi:M81 family metallopeptidase [Pseudochelatococcus lubricantis]|uniref:M81 family metallopeptidase n=1 Tax=Pseudochelatococcus lubricantis TaxID=1538102 RepID=UPI0035F0ABAF